MGWMGENSLSKESAHDLLHLLHHLARDVSFKCVRLPWGYDCSVDPTVLALLGRPQFRIRAVELCVGHKPVLLPHDIRQAGRLPKCGSGWLSYS